MRIETLVDTKLTELREELANADRLIGSLHKEIEQLMREIAEKNDRLQSFEKLLEDIKYNMRFL